MKKVLAVLLVIVVAAGVFLYFPRGQVADALNNAVLAVMNHGVFGQRTGAQELPAFDGDIFATGDLVRADTQGRAVLTFFDGSTVSVEPNSQVRVVSLVKTSAGGIQLTLEQTLGRTWASVSELATADSKFEIRTPSMTAIVRGTAFETIVEKLADGTTTTTVKTGEGEVLVQAEAGGEVTVGANEQVSVDEDEPAPARAEPQPPTPRLRFAAPAGTGFVVIDPRGLRCGATGGATERMIPRCDVSGGSVLIGDVVAGTYSLVMTAARAASGNIEVQGLGVSATDFTHRVAVSLSTADLVRLTLPVTLGGGKLGSSGFTSPELVTSVCGAEASGRVFSGGKIQERSGQLQQFALANKGQPVAFVVTSAELAEVMQEGLSQAQTPVPVSDLRFSIDGSGLHLSAQVAAGPLTIPARADLVVGSVDGRLVVKLRSLDAGIVPDAVKGQITEAIEGILAEAGADFPFTVQRVALRNGCLAILGTTPQ
jgi:FecR-like protein